MTPYCLSPMTQAKPSRSRHCGPLRAEGGRPMRKWWVLALLPVLARAAGAQAGDLVVRPDAGAGKPGIQVENRFFRLTLRPDAGGRISSLVDKRLGKELLYWDEEEGLGG